MNTPEHIIKTIAGVMLTLGVVFVMYRQSERERRWREFGDTERLAQEEELRLKEKEQRRKQTREAL